MKFLSKVKLSNRRYKTPEGYLVCVDSIIARTGKQEYLKSEIFQDSNDDSVIQIDRPKSEVLSPSTIASFENKPLVDEHPDEDVNVDNYRDYAIGFARDVRGSKLGDVDILIANLIFTDPEAIAEIESGEKTELSCGYDCDILGEGDNLYQANIRGNHIALCKAGRAGIARIQDSSSKETKEVVSNHYSEKLKDLSPEERSKKIDELIADEIEAIDGYKEAMKYADEADKSIYSTIIAEELKHIIELKALKNENFEKNNINDAGTTRRMFRESEVGDENSWFGTTDWGTPKGNLYIYRKNGKIIAEGSYNGWQNALQKGEKKEFNSVKELNKWLNTFTEDSNIKDIEKKEFTYINNKKIFEDEENKKMRDGALRGIHLKKIRNTLRNEDEDLVEDFLDYMDTRPDLVKEYDDYSDYMVREDFETWKKYKKIKTRDVDTYEEVTKDLEKELKDSDTLKNLAYKFAQMGNYFDRANSANSRKILGREDNEKIAEFYKLGLEVYKHLEQEVNYLKNNKKPFESPLSFLERNETVDLLLDGAERLVWVNNSKCEALGNKIRNLIKDYKKYNYKDSKVKDSKKYTITFWVRIPGNTPYKETFETNHLEEFDKYLDKYGIGTDYVFINSVASKNGLEFYGSQNKWTDVRKELYRRALRLDSKVKDSSCTITVLEDILWDDEMRKRTRKYNLDAKKLEIYKFWKSTYGVWVISGDRNNIKKFLKENELAIGRGYEIKDSSKLLNIIKLYKKVTKDSK